MCEKTELYQSYKTSDSFQHVKSGTGQHRRKKKQEQSPDFQGKSDTGLCVGTVGGLPISK